MPGPSMKTHTFCSLLTLLALIAGCATPESLRATSSLDLCVRYLTNPSISFGQQDLSAELARRGENCRQYSHIVEAKMRADEAFRRSLRPEPMDRTMMPRRTTCSGNGRTVDCVSQ